MTRINNNEFYGSTYIFVWYIQWKFVYIDIVIIILNNSGDTQHLCDINIL